MKNYKNGEMNGNRYSIPARTGGNYSSSFDHFVGPSLGYQESLVSQHAEGASSWNGVTSHSPEPDLMISHLNEIDHMMDSPPMKDSHRSQNSKFMTQVFGGEPTSSPIAIPQSSSSFPLQVSQRRSNNTSIDNTTFGFYSSSPFELELGQGGVGVGVGGVGGGVGGGQLSNGQPRSFDKTPAAPAPSPSNHLNPIGTPPSISSPSPRKSGALSFNLYSSFEYGLNGNDEGNDEIGISSSPDEKNPDKATKKSKIGKAKYSLQEFYSTVTGPSANNEEEPCRVLWVGNIGPEVTEKDLEQEFSHFGKIESLRILHDRYCAFINFEDEKCAKEAKKNLQGAIIGSQYIVINYRKENAKPPVAEGTTTGGFILNSPSRALWIGNVSGLISEEDLIREFEVFGKIDSVRLLRSKTCAFVNFMRVEDAQRALETLQGKVLGDMPIKINFGKPQPPPQPKTKLEPGFNVSPSSSPIGHYAEFSPFSSSPGSLLMPGGSLLHHNHNPSPNSLFSSSSPSYNSLSSSPLSLPYMPSLENYTPVSSSPTRFDLCPVCRRNPRDHSFSPCGHSTCIQCIQQGNRCQICSQIIMKFNPYVTANSVSSSGSSTFSKTINPPSFMNPSLTPDPF